MGDVGPSPAAVQAAIERALADAGPLTFRELRARLPQVEVALLARELTTLELCGAVEVLGSGWWAPRRYALTGLPLVRLRAIMLAGGEVMPAPRARPRRTARSAPAPEPVTILYARNFPRSLAAELHALAALRGRRVHELVTEAVRAYLAVQPERRHRR